MKPRTKPAKGKASSRAKKLDGKKTDARMNSTPKSDDRWQVEEDVRTLVRADEIRQDKKRLNKAVSEAKRQADRAMRVAKP